MKIEVEPSASTPIHYMNYAEISHGAHDFVMSAVRVPAKFSSIRRSELANTGILNLEPEVQITFPPTLMPSLIEALQKQLEKFEAKKPAVKGKSNGRKA